MRSIASRPPPALLIRYFASLSLQEPSIIFQSNHLIAVNKPAGWETHASSLDLSKCLLTFLRKNKLGGGSNKDFILPLHRLDQPCTGVLLYGKTSKVASRIQTKWKHVDKTYFVVVKTRFAERLRSASQISPSSESCYIASGLLPRKRFKWKPQTDSAKGWSVNAVPAKGLVNELIDSSKYILCHLEWNVAYESNDHTILRIVTRQGARHLIRAILGCYNCPIEGDLRYGSPDSLPDRSVGLHAASICLPEAHIRLPTLAQRQFSAPVPSLWRDFLCLPEVDVSNY